MKLILAIILGIVVPILSFGITEYQPEDKLFIWAESGLNLRESADSKSEVLIKIPFAEEVICKGRKSWYEYLNNSQKLKDKTETTDGKLIEIELKGSWVKVKFGSYEGFVFDSYLSRFKPSIKSNESRSVIEYFKTECDSLIYLEKKDSTLEYGRDKIVFSNGIFMTQNYHSGGSWFQMNLPDFSIEEALLIIRYLDKYAIDIKQKKDGGIWIGQDLGGYTIESYKNLVIISGEWSC